MQKFSEKFSDVEIESLRDDLRSSGLDSWQSAELVSQFLSSRGYGVSRESAHDAMACMEGSYSSIDRLGNELEKLALVM